MSLLSLYTDVTVLLQRLCPPRSTRSFQIIRIADAGPLRHPHLREAQLQVWDAKQMGDKFLQEGARYQVSHAGGSRSTACTEFAL